MLKSIYKRILLIASWAKKTKILFPYILQFVSYMLHGVSLLFLFIGYSLFIVYERIVLFILFLTKALLKMFKFIIKEVIRNIHKLFVYFKYTILGLLNRFGQLLVGVSTATKFSYLKIFFWIFFFFLVTPLILLLSTYFLKFNLFRVSWILRPYMNSCIKIFQILKNCGWMFSFWFFYVPIFIIYALLDILEKYLKRNFNKVVFNEGAANPHLTPKDFYSLDLFYLFSLLVDVSTYFYIFYIGFVKQYPTILYLYFYVNAQVPCFALWTTWCMEILKTPGIG